MSAVLAALCTYASPASAASSDATEEAASTPSGVCARTAPGTPSYRNETARSADTYRRIGKSAQGRPIWAEHWGSSTGPQVLVIGQIHGDECSPAFLVEAFRQRASSTFGFWLIPTLNPDALAAGTRRTPSGADINRDGYKLRTPEARALMSFTRELKPLLSIHIHGPYGFAGSRNGGVASAVANAAAKAAGWQQWQGSGSLASSSSGQAFLWDGQERVLPHHRSVLIELPATSRLEASGAPQPDRLVLTTPARLRLLTARVRDAIYVELERVSRR